jgi:hypothetical protein
MEIYTAEPLVLEHSLLEVEFSICYGNIKKWKTADLSDSIPMILPTFQLRTKRLHITCLKTYKLNYKNTILHVDFCGWETWFASNIKGEACIECIRENGADNNIWTEGG